ncbi:uncharacterized protein LOC142232714 [Haematobia irritans]|uniref:uncharacterized protein LOC142232714 n=1 Tax=Haematobia irritans TaxID=7368 RepID=UPI003F5072CD
MISPYDTRYNNQDERGQRRVTWSNETPPEITIKTMTSAITKTPSTLSTARRSTSTMKRHLLTVEKLRNRVHQILKCVINLHIDILVIESNVNQLIDDVKEFNADLMEVQRLDNLIQTLRDYNGPTICHEWPFPLVYQGTIDEADLAQSLNTK